MTLKWLAIQRTALRVPVTFGDTADGTWKVPATFFSFSVFPTPLRLGRNRNECGRAREGCGVRSTEYFVTKRLVSAVSIFQFHSFPTLPCWEGIGARTILKLVTRAWISKITTFHPRLLGEGPKMQKNAKTSHGV